MTFVSAEYAAYIGAEKYAQLQRAHMSLGSHPETHDTLFVRNLDRFSGIYLLGVPGLGKSSLLENMVAYDAHVGNAIIVMDAHLDLTNHCLARLPAHRLAHTSVLDLEDDAYPIGVNLFSTGLPAEAVIDRTMHIFEVLWEDVLSQQHLPRYLRAATLTLLANPGSTLVDMHTLLLDAPFRTQLVKNVTDPTVKKFWRTQYDNLSEHDRLNRVQSLVGKLEALFMGRSRVRNILGQRENTINFRESIEKREVIFIKLPIKTMTQDARLIGTIIVSQIHAALFSFVNIPEDRRPGVSFYLDEFEHFSTRDIDELFVEGRKYGVRLTVAHQRRGQLPKFLQDSTMSARTKVCFQLIPDDAREMAHCFQSSESTIRPEDMNPHPVEYLLNYGSDDPQVREFIEVYLRSLRSYRRGGKVDIEQKVWSWTSHGVRRKEVFVADPVPYLDSLLYEVMRTGDPTLEIPIDAVLGFANSGRGFITSARWQKGSPLLTSAVHYPPELVINDRWTRHPESSKEQLLHFIFHLRQVMEYVAENPIGKATTTTPAEVAKMLTSLPRRAVFVRTGNCQGVIYTHETLPPVPHDECMQRIQIIRDQTRAKYCRPRAEVELQMETETKIETNPPMINGWEEVE